MGRAPTGRRRDRGHPRRPRLRADLDRHRRGVRQGPLRGARRAGDRGAPRRGAALHEGGARRRGLGDPAGRDPLGDPGARFAASAPTTSTSTRCTGPTTGSRSRRPGAPWRELVREGLARRIGVSNFDRGLVERCSPIHPVASVQNELSLLCRDDTDALLPWLAEQGIGYLAYSPLGSGLLTGTIAADATFAEGDWRREEFTPDLLDYAVPQVERLVAIARADRPEAHGRRARLGAPPARRHGRDLRHALGPERPRQLGGRRHRARPRRAGGARRGVYDRRRSPSMTRARITSMIPPTTTAMPIPT